MELLSLFEWIDGSMLASLAKANGGVFAVVQTFHLLALALLGGTVLASDLRLLGWLLVDVPSEIVVANTDKWFSRALLVSVITGVFLASAVSIKLYYNEMFWGKMAALSLGAVFVYGVRRPYLRYTHATLAPGALRTVAMVSLIIWFTVAACGRWIGFS